MRFDSEAVAELEHLIKHSHGIECEEAEEDLAAIRRWKDLRAAKAWAKTTGRNEARA